MAIKSIVDGNILSNPTQRMVPVKGEQVRLTEFRMMSDVWKRDGDDLVQDGEKTRPVAVTIWNERLGAQVMKLLGKGMRVEAKGDMHLHTWEISPEERIAGKEGMELRVTADEVTLKLNRVEGVTMKSKQAEAESAAA